ncbi:MAG: ribokinase [Clostridiales bacterium]|nr:ribokinase [Clostridiales bacterium]
MKKICVIGSLNMDLVASVERFPEPGETITGKSFNTFPGGKGANQAVAAGRLGADVSMVGKVGDDLYGDMYLKVLKENNVKSHGVGIENGISTGIAVIEVESTSENNIVIIPGANGKVDVSFIDSKWDVICNCDIFLFQLEIPIDTVLYTLKKLKQFGKTTILDPAPARALPEEIFEYIDYITPNETEIEILTKMKIDSEAALKNAAGMLLKRGVKTVIAKMGKKGACIISNEMFEHIPGFRVDAVDTTAAGDSFNAGFAYALSNGNSLKDCVRFANAVGALSTTAMGAQGAMPSIDAVKMFLKSRA